LLLIAAVGLAGAQRAAALSTFAEGATVASLPSGAGSGNDWYFNQTSCGSPGSCVAVGYYEDTAASTDAVVQPITNGAPGTAVEVTLPANAETGPSQDAELNAISCWSAGSCVAVGYYNDALGDEQALVVPISNGVVGVGIEVSLPTNAASTSMDTSLNGVSCWSSGSSSSSGSCIAVGNYPDAAHGNSQGLVVPISSGVVGAGIEVSLPANSASATSSDLADVSCWSAGSCLAVGNYGDNHGNYEALTVPFGNGLVENGLEAAEPGNGLPSGSQNAGLSYVDCPAAGSCVASGYYIDSSHYDQLMVVPFANSAPGGGAEITLPSGAVNGTGNINGLSCLSFASCDAVGAYDNSQGEQPLITPIASGAPGASVVPALPSDVAASAQNTTLTGVSCSVSGSCLAVGYYKNSSAKYASLAVTVAGSSVGAATRVPAPSESSSTPYAGLDSVGCSSSGSCAALGDEYNPSNVYAPYVASFESPLSGSSSLSPGALATPYQSTLAAYGVWGAYSWSVTSGSLPAGLSLNSQTGVISGTPTAAGNSTFNVAVVAAGVPSLPAFLTLSLDVRAPALSAESGALKAKSNRVDLSLTCSDAPCTGPVKLEVTEVVTVKHGKKRVRKHRTVVIGSASFSIAAGQTASVAVTLNGKGRKLLEAAKSHRLSVTELATPTGGSVATGRITIIETVKRHKKKH
jgi:hypothetical protein